jgi:NarL family two-component system response regulator LiaR
MSHPSGDADRSSRIGVLIADDHVVVRKGLCALLATEPGMTVVGEASNGRDAVALAERLHPQVVLMDLLMPEMSGVDATARIVERVPETHVLVLTSVGSDERLFAALKAGAVGYLLKDTSPEELVRAIRQAASGHSTLDPLVARRLLREFAGHDLDTPRESLTARETDVLRLIAHGLSNDEIAARLAVSEPTVRTHVSNVLAKLRLRNRTQAALYALRAGLVSLDDAELDS